MYVLSYRLFTFIAHVVDSVPERKVETVVLPPAGPDIPQVSGAGEVFSVLVEGHSHDPVGGVEGFLHPVAVVNVNIDVENTLVILEQLQDPDYNVVDEAKTTCLQTRITKNRMRAAPSI